MRISRLEIVAAVALAAGLAHAMTADELVAKHVEARGGMEKLRAIRSLRVEGTRARSGGGFETTFLELKKRPGAMRTETTMQGLTMIRAYDGKDGWTIQPFRGRREPERLSADALKEMAYDADLAGPLVDAAAKGNRVDAVGTEVVDGTEALKLRVSRPTGDVDYVYLDPDYFLEIRRVSQRKVRGAEVETQTDFGEYERVGGVYFPFSIESRPRDQPERGQRIRITKAEANVALDDAIFGFPAGAPAAGR